MKSENAFTNGQFIAASMAAAESLSNMPLVVASMTSTADQTIKLMRPKGTIPLTGATFTIATWNKQMTLLMKQSTAST